VSDSEGERDVIDLDVLGDLYAHMEWADASVWEAVLACEAAPADTRMRDWLYHLHLVQRAFLRTWLGEPRDAPYPTFEDAPSLARWGRDYYAQGTAFLQAAGAQALAAPLSIPWAAMVEQRIGRPPAEASLADTALQVAMHSTYHRGQINARLRELGGEPPLVDYIAWVWLGKPGARWPEALGASA
jgi:uncharacterized damage-inducible protein DinB